MCASLCQYQRWPIYTSKTDCHSNDIETLRARQKKKHWTSDIFYFTQLLLRSSVLCLLICAASCARSLLVCPVHYTIFHIRIHIISRRAKCDRSHFFLCFGFNHFPLLDFFFSPHCSVLTSSLTSKCCRRAFYITFICLGKRWLAVSCVRFSFCFFCALVFNGKSIGDFTARVREIYRLVVNTHICVRVSVYAYSLAVAIVAAAAVVVVVSFSFSSIMLFMQIKQDHGQCNSSIPYN